MSDRQEHDGFVNHETREVHWWLANDKASLSSWLFAARMHRDLRKDRNEAIAALAKDLKVKITVDDNPLYVDTHVDAIAGKGNTPTLYWAALEEYFERVDWVDLAMAWMDQVDREDS